MNSKAERAAAWSPASDAALDSSPKKGGASSPGQRLPSDQLPSDQLPSDQLDASCQQAASASRGKVAAGVAPRRNLAPLLQGERSQLIASLRDSVEQLERSRLPEGQEATSSGCGELDRLLPEGGFPPGALVEWLTSQPGCGAHALALIAAREAMWEGGAVLVMDRAKRFYPPAAAALGIDLEQLFVVRAASEADELWAMDQALRCPGVAAVVAEPKELDWRWFRRLQLAAEAGGALGMFLRPAQVRGQPTWSAAQLLVQPLPLESESPSEFSTHERIDGPRRFRIEVLRCRGGRAGNSVEVEMDDVTGALRPASSRQRMEPRDSRSESTAERTHETHTLHLAAQLAHPANRHRSARA